MQDVTQCIRAATAHCSSLVKVGADTLNQEHIHRSHEVALIKISDVEVKRGPAAMFTVAATAHRARTDQLYYGTNRCRCYTIENAGTCI